METAVIVVLVFFALLLTALLLLAFSVQKRLEKTEGRARQQHQNLRYEMYAKLRPLEEALYQQAPGAETVLYDGREKLLPDDFTGQGSGAWDYTAHQFEKGQGEGSHTVDGNVLTVYRTNTEGRYELHLKRYNVDDGGATEFSADSSKERRLLRLQCEVKRESSSHGLRFVFKGEESAEVLDEKDCIVFSPEWQTVLLYFSIAASEPTHLRIDDLHVLTAPSAVQIRNLVLIEKK